MEEKKTIFDYLEQILFTFGFMMICMMCIVFLFGESAQTYSSFFSLGSRGLPVGTMLQFLLLSVLVTFFRFFFFTVGVLKKMGMIARSICMLGSVIIAIVLFTFIFDWFPVSDWQPWCMFLICFLCCFAGSAAVVSLKNKMENKRLAEGLSKMKTELEEQDGKNRN